MTERNRYNQHSGDWYHNHTQQQCGSCGRYYDGFSCPKCGSGLVGSPEKVMSIKVTCLDCGDVWWSFNDIECQKCGSTKTTFMKDWENRKKGEKDANSNQ